LDLCFSSLNLVEAALRKKLESFGIKPRGSYNDLLNVVRKEIREREKRELDVSSAFHDEADLYSFRSKIDHFGLKNKISNKEADFVIEQAFKFIEALKLT